MTKSRDRLERRYDTETMRKVVQLATRLQSRYEETLSGEHHI